MTVFILFRKPLFMTSHCETVTLFFSPSVLASERRDQGRDELTCTRCAEGSGTGWARDGKNNPCQRWPRDTPTVGFVGFLGEGGSFTSSRGAHSHKRLSIVRSGHALKERRGAG